MGEQRCEQPAYSPSGAIVNMLVLCALCVASAGVGAVAAPTSPLLGASALLGGAAFAAGAAAAAPRAGEHHNDDNGDDNGDGDVGEEGDTLEQHVKVRCRKGWKNGLCTAEEKCHCCHVCDHAAGGRVPLAEKPGRPKVGEGRAARAAETNSSRDRAAEAERAAGDRELRDRADRERPQPLTGYAAQEKFRECVKEFAPHKYDAIIQRGLAVYQNYTYTSLVASRSWQAPHADSVYVGTLVAMLQGMAVLGCGGPDACNCAVPCVPKSAHAVSWAAVAGQVTEGWNPNQNRDCRDILL